MELEIPLVLVMNMNDIAEKKGQYVDYTKLSDLLGVAIVSTVGNRNIGTKELLETIIKVCEGKIKTKEVHIGYGPEIREEMNKLEGIVKKDKALVEQYPWRWLIVKMLENDSSVLDIIGKSSVAQDAIAQKEKRQDIIFSRILEILRRP